MAKTKLLEQIKPQIILDERLNLITMALEISDPELYEIISEQKKTERLNFVERALKVGAFALRDAVIRGKLDLIERKFQGLCTDLDKILVDKLGKKGMEGELDKIFGENGELQRSLEDLFGERGRLIRDILDMDNKNSPIGQLRQTIEAYFVGKDSEVYSMLDPNKKDSPMSSLKQDIMKKLDDLKTRIEGQVLEEELIKKTPQKGFKFEDTLDDFLLLVSKPFNDIVQNVAKEKGKLRKQTGDLLITLNDPVIEGRSPSIVIEAKARKSVSLTQKGLLGELDTAIKNREANFAIAVTESPISKSIGNYREYPPNKIICTFGDDGLPLEVAYKVARMRLLIDIYRELEKEEIDVTRINGIVSKMGNDLNSIRGIKAKLTNIGTTSESIKTDIKSLETNIRDSLMELQDSLLSKNT